jgi:hypothetical protein
MQPTGVAEGGWAQIKHDMRVYLSQDLRGCHGSKLSCESGSGMAIQPSVLAAAASSRVRGRKVSSRSAALAVRAATTVASTHLAARGLADRATPGSMAVRARIRRLRRIWVGEILYTQ